MRRLLLGVAGLLIFSGLAQNPISEFPLLLKNETVWPSATETWPATEHNGLHYAIVQHRDLVVSPDFYGFHTLEYLPKHSAFAVISQSEFKAAKAKLEAGGGHVLELNPEWKLSRRMYNQDYPDWAWLGDKTMKTWLRYWPNLEHQTMRMALQNEGLELIDEKQGEDLIAIALNPENISDIQALPYIMFIQEMEDPGEPENFTARTNHRTNALQQNFDGGLNYDGTGIVVGHNDAGMLDNHIDYKGRLTQVGNSSSGSDHGDHTAGTIFGAGNLNPLGEGMAPGSDMYYAPYPDNLNNADNIYNSQNVRLTSNSFSNGCNAGYTNFSRQVDQDASDNPNLLHVFSAGNNGTSDCNYGAGSGWGNVTGGHKQGKNAVTVANLTRVDGLANSSSRGPANDGRIKPDLGAVGTQVFSTTDQPQPNSYDQKTGTSMSCPGVSGSLAVLMQAYKDLNNGTEASGALLKAMILNGADDLGNPGPDFRFGYGRLNVKRSYDMIAGSQYFTGNMSNNDSTTFQINVPGNTAQLKVMVLWPDAAASTSASRALVNDLDITLDDGGTTYQPWVLDPSPNPTSLNTNAVRARDSLNNMEQITIQNPSSGSKTIKIKGFNVPSGPQDFVVVYYFEDQEIDITYPQEGSALSTGSVQLIRWDAPANSGAQTVQYSNDGGNTWFTLTNGTNARTLSWGVPNMANDQVYIRVYNNQDTAIAGPITVAQTPSLINIDAACPDSVELSWNSSQNVSGYVVYQLGAKYMDSIAYITTNSITIAHDPREEDWYAVAAVINDTSIGFRSVAVNKSPGVFSCDVAVDLEISAILSPGRGEIPDCIGGSTIPVILQVTNVGNDTIIDYSLGFQRQGATANIENVNDTLFPGASSTYTFQNSSAILLTNISLNYRYWVTSATPDGNPFNDTLESNVTSYSNSQTISLPHSEDFESFSLCGTDSDCGFTSCQLINGWRNGTNFTADESDFRVDRNGTPSTGTGPNFDHNPGNTIGQYLYAEASGGCDSSEALLNTPCIDLSNTFLPEASIWYHMDGDNGGEMGILGVDVFDGDQWHFNAAAQIAGDQGSSWTELTVDLQEFAGKTIIIRYRAKTGSGYLSDIALDDFSIYDNSGVSLNESALSEFKVYPNPSEGIFYIEAKNQADKLEISVTSAMGAVVLRNEYKSEKRMAIDLAQQSAGVYFLEIRNKQKVETIRLIKH